MLEKQRKTLVLIISLILAATLLLLLCHLLLLPHPHHPSAQNPRWLRIRSWSRDPRRRQHSRRRRVVFQPKGLLRLSPLRQAILDRSISKLSATDCVKSKLLKIKSESNQGVCREWVIVVKIINQFINHSPGKKCRRNHRIGMGCT